MMGAEEQAAGGQTLCGSCSVRHLRVNHVAWVGGGSWMRKSFGMLFVFFILALLVLNALTLPWSACTQCEDSGLNLLHVATSGTADRTGALFGTHGHDCGSSVEQAQELDGWNLKSQRNDASEGSPSSGELSVGHEQGGQDQNQQETLGEEADSWVHWSKREPSEEGWQSSSVASSLSKHHELYHLEEDKKTTGYEIYHDMVCTSGLDPVCFPRVRGLCFSRKQVTLCQGGTVETEEGMRIDVALSREEMNRKGDTADRTPRKEYGWWAMERTARMVSEAGNLTTSLGQRDKSAGLTGGGGGGDGGRGEMPSAIKYSSFSSGKELLSSPHPSKAAMEPKFMRFDGERITIPVVKGDCSQPVSSSFVPRSNWLSLAEVLSTRSVVSGTLSGEGESGVRESSFSYGFHEGQPSRQGSNDSKDESLASLSSMEKSAQWVAGLSLVADERFMPYGRPNPHHEAEKLIPAILLSQRYGLVNSSLYWFASYESLSPWAKGLMSALDFESSVVFVPLPGHHDTPVCFEDAILFSLPTNVRYVPDASTNEWLRSRVLTRCNIPNVVSSRRIEHAVVLDRSSGTRSFGNMQAIVEVLEGELRIPVVPRLSGNGNFCEQVCTVASEDFVVTPHGSHNVNFLFARPGATVIEVFPYLFHTHVFSNFIHAARLHHYEILGLFPMHSPMMWLYSLLGWDACFNRIRWCKNYARRRPVYADVRALRQLVRSLLANQRRKVQR